MKAILVQMSTTAWTMQAVHLACALARSNQTQIVLLRMIPVTHPSYLGTPYGECLPTQAEQDAILEYAATAEDYQVNMSIESMQYVTVLSAVADAADQLDVEIVFADVPASVIPYWQKFRTWLLEHRLRRQHRQLFTLINQPYQENHVPYIVNTPARSPAGQ